MRKHMLKSKVLCVGTVAMIIISSALSVLIAFVLKNILDLLSYEADLRYFYRTILYSGVFILATSMLIFIKRLIKAYYIKSVLVSLKSDTFRSITNYSIPHFFSKKTGDYISNLTNDIRLIEHNYIENILGILADSVTCVIATVALFRLNMYLALITVIASIFPLLIPKITYKRMARLSTTHSKNAENFTSRLKDIFSGFEVIKAFSLQRMVSDDYGKVNYDLEYTKYQATVYQGAVSSIAMFFSYGVQMITISVGVYLALRGVITVGTIVAAGQLMNYILAPLTEIATRINGIKATAPIIEKINQLSWEDEHAKRSVTKHTFDSHILFSNVSFAYGDNKEALSDINVKFEKGKKYAIVGESGSGKSTLIKLLLNYYEDYSGNISMDHQNFRDIHLDDLYKLMAIIHQNVYLFDSSIRDNITLLQDYRDEQVSEAIIRSGLNTLINSLGQREVALIGEAGKLLSGGEKQRIAIARALVRNTPILVMDEATASLDRQTAYSIEKALLDLANTTLITVTHILDENILRVYDEVIVLSHGRLVEQGSFARLIEEQGYFYSMFHCASVKVSELPHTG